ncbi:T9SS type A sorting domain-containing protein [Flagellimonas meishanensis]|uniref:T9SS type A sorting domain-containing protein n=1 Tax=Flagellimonas meishanensis TaxID=2873264 RepID=UPI001CA6259B|nr:T9SS type A sorting domain-containing protein [[Muricauda] meishanensis]
MKEKTTTLHSKTTVFLFLLFLITSIGYAQNAEALLAPVSQLTINDKGEIACEIHANDGAALDHHQMGSSKAGLNFKGSQKVASSSKKTPSGAEINVSYFNFDPDFSMADFIIAATAFQSAVDAWASSISSDVPIFVAAVFQQLGPGVLGSAGPTFVFANNPGLERDTWYGNALADKLSGQDLSPENFDIIARFSTVFPNWYYGTDGNTPAGDFDFKTVVLHELGHGLGFFGSMFVDNATGIGDYGFGIPDPVYPAIYDRLAHSADGKSILKENRYGNFTTALGDVLLSGPLTAKGPRIKKATNGKGAQLFTILDSAIFGDIPGFTDIWLPGSSYSHMDFVTYAGTENGLMVPFLSRGLSYAAPDNIVLSIFDDMGWNGKVNREVMEDRSNNNDDGDGDDPLLGSENVVAIFPNPFSSSLNLTLKEGRSIKKASLTDMAGVYYAVPKRGISNGSQATLDLSGFQGRSGLYFMQLTYDNNTSEVISVYRQ